jgi:hypothetical protein
MVRRAVFNGVGGDHPAVPGDPQSSVVRLTSRGGVSYERVRAKGKVVKARDGRHPSGSGCSRNAA